MQAVQAAMRAVNKAYLEPAFAFSALCFPELQQLSRPSHFDSNSSCFQWHSRRCLPASVDPDDDELPDGNLLGVRVAGTSVMINAKPAMTGRRGRPGGREFVNEQRLEQLVEAVKDDARDAARLLIDDIKQRFPPCKLLEALSIMYPQYWHPPSGTPPTDEDFSARLDAERQCGASTVPPVVSTTELKGQAVAYASIMRLASPNTIIRHMAAVAAAKASGDGKPPSAMTMLWRHVSGNTVLNSQILAFVKLAKIATVMVTGGVENERDNSNLALIKSARRNSLGEVNLNICMRLYGSKDNFTLQNFPYAAAFKAWKAERERRGLAMTLDMQR